MTKKSNLTTWIIFLVLFYFNLKYLHQLQLNARLLQCCPEVVSVCLYQITSTWELCTTWYLMLVSVHPSIVCPQSNLSNKETKSVWLRERNLHIGQELTNGTALLRNWLHVVHLSKFKTELLNKCTIRIWISLLVKYSA